MYNPPCGNAEDKWGCYLAPAELTLNFRRRRGYESSLHLQTFWLLDLWSQGNGLGGDAFSSIKSSPIIYYIETSIQCVTLGMET